MNLRGLRSRGSGRTFLGTAIHAGTAVFDTERMNGGDGDVDAAVEAALDAFKHPGEDVDYDDSFGRGDAEKWAVRLVTAYCLDIGAHRRYAAVELPIQDLEIMTNHGVIVVGGTIDRILARDLPQPTDCATQPLGITDLKSGGRAVELGADGKQRAVTQGHHLQLGIYTITGEHELGRTIDAPAEIVGLQTSGRGVVATGDIPNVKDAMLGNEDSPGFIEMAAEMLARGLFPPNPKSSICSPAYCPAYANHCKYRG